MPPASKRKRGGGDKEGGERAPKKVRRGEGHGFVPYKTKPHSCSQTLPSLEQVFSVGWRGGGGDRSCRKWCLTSWLQNLEVAIKQSRTFSGIPASVFYALIMKMFQAQKPNWENGLSADFDPFSKKFFKPNHIDEVLKEMEAAGQRMKLKAGHITSVTDPKQWYGGRKEYVRGNLCRDLLGVWRVSKGDAGSNKLRCMVVLLLWQAVNSLKREHRGRGRGVDVAKTVFWRKLSGLETPEDRATKHNYAEHFRESGVWEQLKGVPVYILWDGGSEGMAQSEELFQACVCLRNYRAQHRGREPATGYFGCPLATDGQRLRNEQRMREESGAAQEQDTRDAKGMLAKMDGTSVQQQFFADMGQKVALHYLRVVQGKRTASLDVEGINLSSSRDFGKWFQALLKGKAGVEEEGESSEEESSEEESSEEEREEGEVVEGGGAENVEEATTGATAGTSNDATGEVLVFATKSRPVVEEIPAEPPIVVDTGFASSSSTAAAATAVVVERVLSGCDEEQDVGFGGIGGGGALQLEDLFEGPAVEYDTEQFDREFFRALTE